MDINSKTLELWDSLSTQDIMEAINDLTTMERDFSHQIPAGFSRVLENPKCGLPIPDDIHVILSCLDRVRFTENLSITEAVAIIASKGIKLKTVQSVQNTFDRFEDWLGLLPDLPKTVDAKAANNRQRLEWKRKRRILSRDKEKQIELRAQKKALDNQLKRQSKKIINDAKASKITAKEMKTDHQIQLQSTIDRLKAESAESRFVAPEDVVEKDNILFEPTPRQAEFLAAPETVVFYGGAAGGIC